MSFSQEWTPERRHRLTQFLQTLRSCWGRRQKYVLNHVIPYGTPIETYRSLDSEEDGLQAETFAHALLQEGLLGLIDPETDRPVLNVCLGFANSELECSARALHLFRDVGPSTSRSRKRSSRYLDLDGETGRSKVDNLPGTVWMECVEPTLMVLISLNKMKRRKSNISVPRKMPPAANIDSRIIHGDIQEDPWFVGPRLPHIRRRGLGMFAAFADRLIHAPRRGFSEQQRNFDQAIGVPYTPNRETNSRRMKLTKHCHQPRPEPTPASRHLLRLIS